MKKIGIHELFAKDKTEAEKKLYGASANRRGFLKKSAIVAMGSILGANVVFGKNYAYIIQQSRNAHLAPCL